MCTDISTLEHEIKDLDRQIEELSDSLLSFNTQDAEFETLTRKINIKSMKLQAKREMLDRLKHPHKGADIVYQYKILQ